MLAARDYNGVSRESKIRDFTDSIERTQAPPLSYVCQPAGAHGPGVFNTSTRDLRWIVDACRLVLAALVLPPAA
jgi:hypothetical protein